MLLKSHRAEAAHVAEDITTVLVDKDAFFPQTHATCRSASAGSTRGRPLRTAGGGAVVVHSDITERHMVQERLRKLSPVATQSPIGIAIRDTAGRIE